MFPTWPHMVRRGREPQLRALDGLEPVLGDCRCSNVDRGSFADHEGLPAAAGVWVAREHLVDHWFLFHRRCECFQCCGGRCRVFLTSEVHLRSNGLCRWCRPPPGHDPAKRAKVDAKAAPSPRGSVAKDLPTDADTSRCGEAASSAEQ